MKKQAGVEPELSEDERRQILFYFDSTRLGPSQRAVVALIDALLIQKFVFRVLVPESTGGLPEQLRARGIEPDVLAMPATFRAALSNRGGVRGWFEAAYGLLAYYRKLFRYFKMYNFGVLHSDGLRAHLLSIGIKVRFNVPLIWNLWTILTPGMGLRLFCNLAAIFSDHLVASSMFVAHQLGRSQRWRKGMTVLYRGYDPTLFAAIRRTVHVEPLVATVASFENANGYKTFLIAFEQALREVPELRAVVLVEGSDPAHITVIEEFGRTLKIDDALSVQPISLNDGAVGIAPELTRRTVMLYVNSSVDLAPFHSDVAEAMGVGIPVVASRIGVLAELILSESTGLLFKPGDAKDLAEALVRLAHDEKLRAELASNAKREFLARFGVAHYVSVVARNYADHLVSGSSDVPAVDADKKAA